jgi:hypothetical protein
MAVLKNKNNTDLYIDCYCGCDYGIRFKIDKEEDEYYCFMTYTNGNFYTEQNDTFWRVFHKKLKKIWAIIRNKDFYYSDVHMTKSDWEEFKEYINNIE